MARNASSSTFSAVIVAVFQKKLCNIYIYITIYICLFMMRPANAKTCWEDTVANSHSSTDNTHARLNNDQQTRAIIHVQVTPVTPPDLNLTCEW